MFASLLGLSLVPGSWIGCLAGLPVQNMLSAEGIRWLLQNLRPNVEASPCFAFFVLVMGLGVLRESGLSTDCRQLVCHWRRSSALSRKRRQALSLAALSFFVYVWMLCLATFSRHEILLGVTGTLERSPFLAGWPFLLAVGASIPGGIYGLASGKFRGAADCIHGLSSLFAPMAVFFVYVFVMAQCMGMIAYIRLDAWSGVPMDVLSLCVYHVPFLFSLIVVGRERSRSVGNNDLG